MSNAPQQEPPLAGTAEASVLLAPNDRQALQSVSWIRRILIFVFVLAATNGVVWWLIQPAAIVSLEGHQYGVNKVVFSSDGATVASASDDATVKLWSSGGSLLRTISGHSNRVTAVAFTSAGKVLASASGIGNVRLWDVDTGIELASFRAHQDCIHELAFNKSGDRLYAVGWDSTLSVWDPYAGRLIKRVSIPSVAECCAITLDESVLLVGCVDGTIRAWDLTTNVVSVAYDGHFGQVESIRVSGDGTKVLSSARDQSAHVWALESKSPTLIVNCDSPLRGAVFLHNETCVLVATESGQLQAYRCSDGLFFFRTTTDANSFLTLTVFQQEQFAAGGYDAATLLFSSGSIPMP